MTGIKRMLSREESQNNENEDVEKGYQKQTKPTDHKWMEDEAAKSKLLNNEESSKITGKDFSRSREAKKETSVNMVTTQPTKRQQKRKSTRGHKLWCFIKRAVTSIFAVAVVYLLYRQIEKDLREKQPILKSDTTTTTVAPPRVEAQVQQLVHEITESERRPLPEEYKPNIDRLVNKKELVWIPEGHNKQVFSTASGTGACIIMKTNGPLKVFNSVTLKYEQTTSLFHAVALERANKTGLSRGQRVMLVKKANYQWSTPQTGRQPSTLQFVVEVEVGDQLCVQMNKPDMVYASWSDNVFLIEKL